MSGRRAICGFLALAVLLLCAVPAAASGPAPAAPGLFAGVSRLNDELALIGQGSSSLGSPGSQPLSEIRFDNRDGYTISVIAFGQTVALSVSRAQVSGHRHDGDRKVRDRASTTTYLAHGKVTPTSIAASFGDRGRIAVRFRASGREVHATRRAGCKRSSDGILADLGVFSGDLRFEGEGGYTSAEIHRAPGRSVDLAALLACLFGASPGGHVALPPSSAPLGIDLPGLVAAEGRSVSNSPAVATHPSTGPKATTLFANRKMPLSRTVFAARAQGKGPSRFIAYDEASEGSIGVIRVAYARGAPGAFAADPSLSTATAAPPPPFSGTGTLERRPASSKSWSGSLAVSFLGAPHVPLTGAPFDTSLARGF